MHSKKTRAIYVHCTFSTKATAKGKFCILFILHRAQEKNILKEMLLKNWEIVCVRL